MDSGFGVPGVAQGFEAHKAYPGVLKVIGRVYKRLEGFRMWGFKTAAETPSMPESCYHEPWSSNPRSS